MNRFDIIEKIGKKYFTSNLENWEFSYARALKSVWKDIKDFTSQWEKNHCFLDIRFEDDRLVILVECKNKFSKWPKQEIQQQLQEYVRFEKEYTNKKIVAILAETEWNDVYTWLWQSVIIDDNHCDDAKFQIYSFEEYEDFCFWNINDKIKVVDSIKTLNELLNSDWVDAKLRSQFVWTCLLALKNWLVYKDLKPTIDKNTWKELKEEKIIIKNIRDILEWLLTKSWSLNKAGKLAILSNKVLDDQDIKSLNYKELLEILSFIDNNVIPYINDKSTAWQDLLNLFFTTFNKYVGKTDKNQAFTPDHICDFMSKAVWVNRNSIVLDPCCWSWAFLVRAMTDAMDDCNTEEERENVKKKQIYWIEYEDWAFGLSSTNMLIHGDWNSNVIQDSMFNRWDWIQEKWINIVLMNPPYNATKKCCDPEYIKTRNSDVTKDPSKGFHFLEYVARYCPSTCKIAVLLPMQAAIWNSKEIKKYKKIMLEKYTLDAVFSLPNEVFYPWASAVACCMIFDLSQRHEKSDRETFFWYFKDDWFAKRKWLWRVEKVDNNWNSLWQQIENMRLNLYKNKKQVAWLSVMKKITFEDERLAEAYMETNYSEISVWDFENTRNMYLSYLVSSWDWEKFHIFLSNTWKFITKMNLNISEWKEFNVDKLFNCSTTKLSVKEDLDKWLIPLISRTALNNWCDWYFDIEERRISKRWCITIWAEWIYAFFQPDDFWTWNKVYTLRNKSINDFVALFLCTILNKEDYRYSYWRARVLNKIKNENILLPIKKDALWNPVIDNKNEYSDEWYIPDREFMENYIKNLPYWDRI